MPAPTKQTLRERIIAEDPDGVVETPSQKIIKANRQANTKTIEDELGRQIITKKLGPVDHMRLFKMLGDLSSNEMYTRYAVVAASVQSIDGDPGPGAVSQLTIEARVAWIAEEGFAAIWADMIKSSQEYLNDRTPEQIAEEHSASLKKDSE